MAAQPVLEQPLPHNLEAERSVLGAILLDNTHLDLVVEKGLKADDFFLPHHRRLFEAMFQLGESNTPIDLVTLMDYLHRRGELEAAGGQVYVASIGDGMPRVVNVEHYARIVREKSLLRHLIHTTHSIQQQALEAGEDADEILDRAEHSIFELAEDRVRAGFVGIRELVRESYPRLEEIFSEGRRITGLPTGYDQLDNLLSGLQPSELIILAARPSMGKTSLALNIAENIVSRQGKPVAIFSLEMSKESLLLRLLSSQARVDSHKFRTGHIGKDDFKRMLGMLGQLGEAPLWIDDTGSTTVPEMGAKARRLKRDKGLSLLIVDYLQLITARGRFGNRQEEVASISRSLKALAKELRIPVLVLSQLTRAPERDDRRPQLADLRESGAIEQDADVVMFIHRPYMFKPDVPDEDRAKAELIVAKQRNGPTDRVHFVFLGSFTRFEEAAPENYES
jgi:replicative DNA helicase